MPPAHNVVSFQRSSRPTTPALPTLADEENAPRADHLGTAQLGPNSVWKYTVCAEIARGGMASIHFGWSVSASGIRRPVALKRIRAGLENAAELEAGLRSEALLGCHIRHPNVIPVLDLVEIGGVTFLVMEYVLGRTLASLLEGRERPSVATSVAIIGGALRGLHAAHTAMDSAGRALDVIHRDVSPQNLLIGVDGIARVLDFGVAKTCDSEPTRIGHVKGKIGYFAPEQFFNEPLDARTDVFAAGVVLWEALAGRRLFQRRDPLEDVADLATHQLRAVSDFNPRVPKRLAAVLARALHPSREHRFDTAEGFAEALEEVVRPSSPSEVARYLASHRGHSNGRRAQPRRPEPREERVPSMPVPQRFPATSPRPAVASEDDEVTTLHRDHTPGRAALDSQDVTVLQPPPVPAAAQRRAQHGPKMPAPVALPKPRERAQPSASERRVATAPAALDRSLREPKRDRSSADQHGQLASYSEHAAEPPRARLTAPGHSRPRTLRLGAASLALLLLLAATAAALHSRHVTASFVHRLWSNLGLVIGSAARDANALLATTERLRSTPTPIAPESLAVGAVAVRPAQALEPRAPAAEEKEVVRTEPSPISPAPTAKPPQPTLAAHPKPALGARSRGSARCRPPYRYDQTGIKRMKLPCL